jgi:3-oxoacyl-[acyl-carrier protein] reductase
MDLGLQGLTALVTGSSRGLGFATAQELAREGCRVAINSRSDSEIQTAARELSGATGTPVIGICGDVSDPAFPAQLVRQSAEVLGGMDILITNAGGPPSGKFEDLTDEAWAKAIELTLMSHVRLIREALPYLRKSPSPAVLTITSYAVKQPIPNLVLSNSIRAATVGLTKTLALELGVDKIRCNSILPAWTLTERVEELMSARAETNHTSIEDEMRKQAGASSFGRMASPEEFAKPAAFLVSPAASYITGLMLTVDGGMYKGTL